MTKKFKKLDPNKPTIARKGLVVCYIGDGKGKTSAAMGLAVRASGAGMNVSVLQFVKAEKPKNGDKLEPGEWPISNEINFFDNASLNGRLGKIESDQVGVGFVGILGDKKEKEQHIRAALNGLEKAREIIVSGKYQLVVLDEIISALELDLLKEQDILDLLSVKPEMLHVAITGHSRYPKIIKQCDLVTEMKMVKHPYYDGVLAQRGIDF